MSRRPQKWAKVSADGFPIPARCPFCHSRQTVLATYADGSKVVECNGCYGVIYEYEYTASPLNNKKENA